MTGCSNPNPPSIVFESYQSIKLHKMHYQGMIGIPLEILKNNKSLLISDFHGDSLISILNIDDGSIYKIAPVGNGPGEVRPPVTMQIAENMLFVHSRGNNILYKTSLSNIMNKGKNIKLSKQYNMISSIDRLCYLTNTLYVASGYFEDHRYALMDSLGSVIKYFGEFPDLWDEERNIPNIAKSMFHDCMFLKNTQEQLFATVASHVLEIWGFNRDEIYRVNQIELGKYRYYYQTGDIVTVNKMEDISRGGTFATSSDKYIYIVYNDQKTSIWIFDWKGNPIKSLSSEYDIFALCVDEEQNKAYCIIDDDSDYRLTYFNIPR